MAEQVEQGELIIGREGFGLPLDTVVGKTGIVGMSGAGKSQTARKLVESMVDAQAHVAVLDPMGVWWGLRSSADGASAGYGVVVFGGDHGDAPLRADSGGMLAKALMKERFNAVFDMRGLGDGEVRQFSTGFLRELYAHNRHPLMVVMDEFDIICPQAKAANSEDAREAVTNQVRRGRVLGLGSMMITQNPQDADKSVLNMSDTVIAMRTQGSHAIDAIGKWMGRNLTKERLAEMMSTLPELETGTGWVWAPQRKVFEVVPFLLCKTYDSGKTPAMGEVLAPPRVLAQVDVAALGRKIAATVEEAKATDPAALKAEVERLKRLLDERGDVPMGMAEDIARLEQQAARVPELEDENRRLAESEGKVRAMAVEAAEMLDRARARLGAIFDIPDPFTSEAVEIPLVPQDAVGASLIRNVEVPTVPSDDLNGPQHTILDAVAALYRVPGAALTLEWVAATCGTTARARGFKENLRVLRRQGYLSGLALTDKGRAVAKTGARIATFEDALRVMSKMLSDPQLQILRVLKTHVQTPPELALLMGTTERARGFEENVRVLKRHEYVQNAGGRLVLGDWLQRLPRAEASR